MASWYYYNKNDEKVGPISSAALKSLAEQGLITPETLLENSDGRSAAAGRVNGLAFPKSVEPSEPETVSLDDIDPTSMEPPIIEEQNVYESASQAPEPPPLPEQQPMAEANPFVQDTPVESNPFVTPSASDNPFTAAVPKESNPFTVPVPSDNSSANPYIQKAMERSNAAYQNAKPHVVAGYKKIQHWFLGLSRRNQIIVACVVGVVVIGMIGLIVSKSGETSRQSSSRLTAARQADINKLIANPANLDGNAEFIAVFRRVARSEPPLVALKLNEVADMLESGTFSKGKGDEFHAMIIVGLVAEIRATQAIMQGEPATTIQTLATMESELPPIMRPFFRAGSNVGAGILQVGSNR